MGGAMIRGNDWQGIKAKATEVDPAWNSAERMARRRRMRQEMLASVGTAQPARTDTPTPSPPSTLDAGKAAGMADEFQELLDSLHNRALSAICEPASQVRIIADPVRRTAHVVALVEQIPADDEYDALLGRLVELRDFQPDQLALSFSIEELERSADDHGAASTSASTW